MLARKFRLPSSIIFQHPFFIRDISFLMKYQKNKLSYNRYAVVVSKNVDKRATERNAIKRTIRFAAEQNLGKGYDVLFIVKPAVKTESRDVLISKILSGLKKVI